MKFNRAIGLNFICFLVLLLSTMVVSAQILPIDVERVEIDDIVIRLDTTNRLDVERGQEIDVQVKFTSSVDLDDLELEAFISGFEYNRFEPMTDTTATFDADANITYVKNLKLHLSDELDEDDYLLRILFTDRSSDALILNFRIKIDVPRHGLVVEDVILFPGKIVRAGTALLTTVRVENKGERDEDDVKVEVRIPDLGLSAVDYIEEVEFDEEEETEEIFLRIPTCTEPGRYPVEIIVSFDEGFEEARETTTITVLSSGNPSCNKDQGSTGSSAGGAPVQEAKTLIIVGSQMEQVKIGGDAANFPLTVTNQGSQSTAYSVSVRGVESFGDIKISPSSTVVLEPGKSQSFYLFVTANEDAPTGPQLFTVTVSSGTNTLQQVTLTAQVLEKSTKDWSVLSKLLTVGLLILVVLLVLVGLAIIIKKVSGGGLDEEPELDESQTYY